MTRATLRQRLCGFSKRDRAKLKRTEKEAVAIAVAAAEERQLPWMAVDPGAHPAVYQGRITWYVVGQKHPTTRPPPNAVYVDDETGEVVGVQRYLR
ncbi:MAG: hypothetical protein MI785_22220 [Kiloniellales bacterium]|nr:hypothetical protein [Kiloniellales bacterium]